MKDYKQYCDIYFLRSKKILEKDNLNPWVKMQVFIRKPGIIAGIDESVQFLREHSNLFENKGKIYALEENSKYRENDTVMIIEGHLQDIIEFETIYLGIITSKTTMASENRNPLKINKIKQNMKEIVELAKPRPVIYFGARHWHYKKDKEITKACFEAGIENTSTQVGADIKNKKAVGTIPHALVLTYGDTVKATKAFDRYIDRKVKRVALVDTFNKEITDSLRCAKEIPSLDAVRLDTAGENYGEKCKEERGVTVELAAKTRKALDKENFQNVGIFLSSGFNAEKTEKFIEAEKSHGKLFDGIGTGSVFPKETRKATADLVEKNRKPCAKVGRQLKPNPELKLIEN